MKITRVTAFVHRVSLLAIAAAGAVALVAQNYGVEFGLSPADVLAIVSGTVAVSTIARAVSDNVTKAGDVLQEQITILRNAVEAISSRGEVELGVTNAVLDRTEALSRQVDNATVVK